jgi:hypothetical protein
MKQLPYLSIQALHKQPHPYIYMFNVDVLRKNVKFHHILFSSHLLLTIVP